MLIVGLLGDVHGNFDAVFHIINKNPNVGRWFQIGDLGGEDIKYPEFPSNFHFIQGNHENWDHIEKLKSGNSPVFMKNGSLTWYKTSGYGYCIGVLGGNYSAKAYDTPTRKLSGNRRRFFTSDDYDALVLQDIQQRVCDKTLNIDILLTHEAPSPFIKSFGDIGIHVVTELIKRIKPTIHFFGHHHHYVMSNVGETVSIGLDRINRSYVLYDPESNMAEKVDV